MGQEFESLQARQNMVIVAQLVEPWIVIPVVVGSSPIGHPIFHFRGSKSRNPIVSFEFQQVLTVYVVL